MARTTGVVGSRAGSGSPETGWTWEYAASRSVVSPWTRRSVASALPPSVLRIRSADNLSIREGARAEVDVQQPPGGSVEAPPVHHSYITHPWPMACSKRLRFVRTGGGPPSDSSPMTSSSLRPRIRMMRLRKLFPWATTRRGGQHRVRAGAPPRGRVRFAQRSSQGSHRSGAGHRRTVARCGPGPHPSERGGTLVKSLKITIHPFIQSPCHVNWQGVILRIGTEVRPRMPLHFPLEG